MDTSRRPFTIILCLISLLFLPLAGSAASNQTGAPLALGDQAAPATPGIATVLGSDQGVPNWADIFAPDHSFKDQLNEFGEPQPNGVPDFLDTWGPFRTRRDAVFVADRVSADFSPDPTVRLADGRIGPGHVEAQHDISNAYAYSVLNTDHQLVLYLGAERLSNSFSAPSWLIFELDQGAFHLDENGYLVGGLREGDLRIRAEFDGVLVGLELQMWQVTPQGADWVTVEQLSPGDGRSVESCNEAGNVCAFSNSGYIASGGWATFDAFGRQTDTLAPDTFLEVGINISQLLGRQPTFQALRITSPQDYASGAFVRATKRGAPTNADVVSSDSLLPTAKMMGDMGVCMQEVAGFNLNCTANDVALTQLVNPTVLDDGCAYPGDTVTFTSQAYLELTTQARYDLGVYIDVGGDPEGDLAYTGSCYRTTVPYQPDPPYLDMDGTSDDPSGLIQDTCGDIDDAHSPLLFDLGTLTIACVDSDGDGNADLPNCESWRQPGSNDLCVDITDAYPGTPAKCNCGILNTFPIPKVIELTKSLIPSTDDGLFDLEIGGTAYATDVTDGGTTGPQSVDPGTVTVSESAGTGTDLADYDSAISCADNYLDDGDDGVVASCSDCSSLDVTVPSDGLFSIICTATNTRKPALKLVKSVTNDNGGTAVAGDWTLTATGGSDGFSDSGDPSVGVFHNVTAGQAYTLSESSESGYSAGSWSCDGGTLSSDQVTLAVGEQVTCTIVNDDIAPTLKLVKSVTNDDGGTAVPGDWTLTATGDGGFSDNGDSTTFHTVKAGVAYSLSESDIAGYSAGSWSCDGGTLSGSSITLGLDEDVTCTIVNDDIAPTLKLVKSVTNDNGGTAVAGDWTLTATGGSDGFSDNGDPSVGVFHTMTAGQGYALSESTVAGYSAGSWSCDGGTVSGSSITLGLDEDVTCTIVNNDIGPTLKLVKSVTNDDGGTNVAGDWTLTATGGSDGFSDNGDPSVGIFHAVTAGQGYALSESTVAGYSAGSWSCDGGTLSGSSITLGLDEDVTCTIVNDDIAPTLKLVKSVTNDDGGTNVAGDWTLTATGGSDGFSDNGDPSVGVFHTMTAGQGYALSESTVAGYSAGSWSCDGGTLSGSSITLGLDEDVTCTIVNDDIAPTLKLVKSVTNDNGGTAVAGDWTLTATGGSDGFSDNGDPAVGAFHTMTAGQGYALSESTVTGYSAGSWSCNGGTLAGSTITLGLDDDVTCTIVNDDIAPSLTLVKQVTNDNGGTAVATDWTLSAAGPTPISGAGGTSSGAGFSAGTYSLSESTGPVGYSAGSWSCVGGSQAGDQITLGLGENATCTIVNNDIAPSLTLVKQVVNDSGGTAVTTDWTLSATGPTPISGAGGTSSGAGFSAGTYALSESTGPAGYAAGSWSCVGGSQTGDQIALGLAESAMCTIVNDDIPPTLTVTKVVINNFGPDSGLFNLTIDGSAFATDVGDGGSTGAVSVMAGSHAAGETAGTSTALSDYVSSIGGDCAPDGSITLALAQNATCVVTNVAKASAEVYKTTLGVAAEGFSFEIREGASTTAAGTVLGSCTTDAAGYCDFAGLKLDPTAPATFQFCETGMMPGWYNDLDGFTPAGATPEGGDNSTECVDFVVTPGETVTFNVDNSPPPGGDARTIGFWKNWTSCDGHGHQDPVLDQTLATFPIDAGTGTHGFWLGDIFIDNCEDAVSLLDKRDVRNGKKMAGDAAYGLAAQLLAAILNVQAQAGTCPEATQAISGGLGLLGSIHFDGSGRYLRPNSHDPDTRILANELAGQLDLYNNNNLCPATP